MIQNERQYRVTRAQAERFEKALDAFRDSGAGATVDPVIARAQEEALSGQLDELRSQIQEYERLSSGRVPEYELESLDQLPDVLVRARIAAGLTQKGLAERLGLPEQQLQRYEATGYSSASFSRLIEVSDALGLQFRERLQLPRPVRFELILMSLRRLGFDADVVKRRLLPSSLLEAQFEAPNGSGVAANRLAAVAARILGSNVSSILRSEPVDLGPLLAGASFKLPARARDESVQAYAAYARYLAMKVLDLTEGGEARDVPTDAASVYAELRARGGPSFESLLEYVWSLGITVLPLRDPGAFHAAMWRRDGRAVIVLKQTTRSSARWTFDLLHELRHVGEDGRDEGIVEASQAIELPAKDDDREIEANEYAGEGQLGPDADALARSAASRARGRVALLKAVAPQVAEEAGLPVDAFANFLAYRLGLQGINWWGTATVLQTHDDPWGAARDFLLQHVDISRLDTIDRDLLGAALSEE